MRTILIALICLFTVQGVNAQVELSDVNAYLRKVGVEGVRQVCVVSNCDGIESSNAVSCRSETINTKEIKVVTNINSLLIYDELNKIQSVLVPYNQIAFFVRQRNILYIYIKQAR